MFDFASWKEVAQSGLSIVSADRDGNEKALRQSSMHHYLSARVIVSFIYWVVGNISIIIVFFTSSPLSK
jgi:hypothetical protein